MSVTMQKKADRLKELHQVLLEVGSEVETILGAGPLDDRSAILASELRSATQAFGDYLPFADELVDNAVRNHEAVAQYSRTWFKGPVTQR